MFASKVDSGMGGGGGGGNGAPSGGDFARERKLSNTSSQGSMKNKWVKAFKSIKGGKEAPVEPRYVDLCCATSTRYLEPRYVDLCK